MVSPLISIIIPVYNVENYLHECIESVVKQSYTNLEIILIDDGSTDSSGVICDQWGKIDKRIKVIHQKNQGAACAKNVGLDVMGGVFFEIVDSDDILRNDILEIQLSLLLEHGVDIVESDLFKFYTNDEISKESQIESSECIEYNAQNALAELMLNRHLHQTPVCKLYKSSLVKSIRFVPGTYIDDEFWTYRVFGEASRILKYGINGYYYRQHNRSAMGRPYSIERAVILKAFEQRMHYMSERFPEVENIAWLTFMGTSIYHFQKLCANDALDPDKNLRKNILNKYNSYYSAKQMKLLPLKKYFRLYVFRKIPFLYSAICNKLNKGV